MNSTGSNKLSRRKILAFSAITLVVFVLAGELVLRAFGFSPPDTCYTNVSGIHHLHKANWTGTHTGKKLITNQWGFGRQFPQGKAEG